MAIVGSVQALRDAVSEKLTMAAMSVYELQQAELPALNRHQEPRKYVVDFLHAAHGIVPVVKTFADGRLQKDDFKSWRASWEANRLQPGEEQGLWLQLQGERVAQEHGEGAGLKAIMIPITRGEGHQHFTNYAALGIRPIQRPSMFKGGVEFSAYPGRPASEVCRQYLGLCQRFWRDFQEAHRHLF